MNKIIVIKCVEDFDKIRFSKGCEKLTIYLLKDVNFDDGYNFSPIDLTGTDVVFYGLGNTLSNLLIDCVQTKQIGLFSNVNNLYVKKLKIIDSKINGDEICGVLAGHVDDSFVGDEIYVDSKIDCHAIAGGVVGSANVVCVNDSTICSTIMGKGILGGIAGMADNCFVSESLVSATFKPKSQYVSNKNMIDNYVGYLGSRENPRIMALTEDVNDYLEEKNRLKLTL